MNQNDLSRLTPAAFEELCVDFIKASGFENVTYFGAKGSDKGRDITAVRRIEDFPGHFSIQNWIIQCKRVRKISTSELETEVSKITSFTFDHFLLLTSSKVSANLRDAIPGIAQRHKITVQVIDGFELCRLIDQRYPELSVLIGSESNDLTQLRRINDLFFRNRVIASNSNPHLDRFLNEYLELGHIAIVELLSAPRQKVYVHPSDGVFHAVASGLKDMTQIKESCGGFLGEGRIKTAVQEVRDILSSIKEIQAVSLDWSDTLVDEVNLDEHICESLAKVQGPPDYRIDQYYRFNRILHSLHSRADPKWFDYSYLASLMGKTKNDVMQAHRSFSGSWGLFPGAKDFLSLLVELRKKRNLKIGIVTHCYRDFLYERASLLGINMDIFDFVVTGEEAADMTDKELLITQALKRSDIEPRNLLHVGDNVARDIFAANRLGCRTLLAKFVIRDSQTFWTSAQSPFSGDLLEVRMAQHTPSDWGFVSSFEQLIRIMQ